MHVLKQRAAVVCRGATTVAGGARRSDAVRIDERIDARNDVRAAARGDLRVAMHGAVRAAMRAAVQGRRPAGLACARAVAHAGLIASLLLAPAAVRAQAINVVAPTLPPRHAGAATAAPAPGAATVGSAPSAPSSPQAATARDGGGPAASPPAYAGTATPGTPGYAGTPAYGTATQGGTSASGGATSAPAYGAPSAGTAAYGTAAYGTTGHGTTGYGTTGQGAPAYGSPVPAARAPAAPTSALAARGGYAPSAHGSAAATNDAALAAMPVARSSAAGACRAEPSPDRQSVTLLGADALPRQHVPLGEFRVQQVIHSPDGRWAVALTKLRGRPQFAALALDLARCAPTHTIDLPAAAEDARFEADEAVLLLGGRERRMKLADARVR